MNNQVAKCPWCNQDLEHGTFRSRGGNYFLPDGNKTPNFFTIQSMKRKNAIMLPPYPIGDASMPEAYVCRGCQKIIIPYKYE